MFYCVQKNTSFHASAGSLKLLLVKSEKKIKIRNESAKLSGCDSEFYLFCNRYCWILTA